MKKALIQIIEYLKVCLIIFFITWVFYVAIPYRLSHPELTETQFELKVFSMGFYNPLKKD